jgi:hypothetical protein
MEERRKDYSVLEQLVLELAQLLGKKIVDREGGNDDLSGSAEAVISGNGTDRNSPAGGTQSLPDALPATPEVSETKPATPSAAAEIKEGDLIETDTLNKAELVAIAQKCGIPFDQKWTEDKLRQVLEAQLKPNSAKAEPEKPATTEKPVKKLATAKDRKPKVGETILVNEDGKWVEYTISALRGTSVYTKKWQLALDDEGTEWKYKE